MISVIVQKLEGSKSERQAFMVAASEEAAGDKKNGKRPGSATAEKKIDGVQSRRGQRARSDHRTS